MHQVYLIVGKFAFFYADRDYGDPFGNPEVFVFPNMVEATKFVTNYRPSHYFFL